MKDNCLKLTGKQNINVGKRLKRVYEDKFNSMELTLSIFKAKSGRYY